VRTPKGVYVCGQDVGLVTDLYELTMAAGYCAHGRADEAVFELFCRELPRERGFLLAAGLEQALEGLLGFGFPAESVEYLRGLPAFSGVGDPFFETLRGFRFTGSVHAVDEGRVVFAGEPLLRVRAPIIEAQVVETLLLTHINLQTLVATKAARVVEAAAGRTVVDFGSRRAHGPEAGVLAARASYLAGCTGTSNLLAGRDLGIPVCGTAAHSWTMSWPTEEEAFRRYRDVFGDRSVLLVDTYDTIEGVRRASATGPGLGGVRLDSGDLASLSREARALLDREGQESTRIIASGDLDEYRIAELVRAGAPIDAFGVGTRMVTSFDEPALGVVYKLVEVAGRPVLKSSEGKATYPGPRQVFRFRDGGGRLRRDVIAHADEELEGGEPLLVPYIEKGRLCRDVPSVEEARGRAATEIASLAAGVKRLRSPASVLVERTATLERLREEAGGR
jgi:nicotinate phosphoribosyltransferase